MGLGDKEVLKALFQHFSMTSLCLQCTCTLNKMSAVLLFLCFRPFIVPRVLGGGQKKEEKGSTESEVYYASLQ